MYVMEPNLLMSRTFLILGGMLIITTITARLNKAYETSTELFINDLVTSSEVKSFFLIPEVNLVSENSDKFSILLNHFWYHEKFFVLFG